MINIEADRRGYVPADEVARMLGVTKGCLAKWRSESQGPAYYRLAGRIWYRHDDLEAFVEQSRVTTSSARQADGREAGR